MNRVRNLVGLLPILFCLTASEASARDGFEHYGAWSNVEVSQSEDPHASGFELTLWQYQGKLMGYLSQYVGPVADPPLSEIENLTLDGKTGHISFRAKMSIGMVHSRKEGTWVPSKDLYFFKGIMSDDRIEGTLERKSEDEPNRGGVKEKIALKGRKGKDEFWDNMTYQEWKDFYAPIVKSRGPKW